MKRQVCTKAIGLCSKQKKKQKKTEKKKKRSVHEIWQLEVRQVLVDKRLGAEFRWPL